jgi:hypothetical protein
MNPARHSTDTDATPIEPRTESGSQGSYGPRLRRAILTLVAAIGMHLWLVPAPGTARFSRSSLAIAPVLSQSGIGLVGRTATNHSIPAVHGRPVEVRSEFVTARQAAEPADADPRGMQREPDVPVATSGFLRAQGDVAVDGRETTAPALPIDSVEYLDRLPSTATSATPLLAAMVERTVPVSSLALSTAPPPEPAPSFANAPSASVTAPAVERTAEVQKQEDIVRKVLLDYTRAFEHLDVQATKAIWPSVDDRALQRAFQQLDSQQLRFASCGVSVSGRDANARCRGEATYRPKVGSRVLRLTEREWTFSLSRDNDRWRIVNATLQ